MQIHQRSQERMSDTSFRLMNLTFQVIDFFSSFVEKRSHSFDLKPGMCVVDYGCGPGRYTIQFAQIVGKTGKVYAVDIQELALEAVRSKMRQYHLTNIQPVLSHGYYSGLPDAIADRIFALDMFFGIKQPAEFLAELKRLLKPEGLLIIDDGHQPREVTRQKILDSGLWVIESETKDHLECRPV
jgi:ubiquinone/menaquinone biosynthesis C-methylase UbiE